MGFDDRRRRRGWARDLRELRADWALDLIDAAANGWAQGGFVRRQRRHELAAAACTEEARAGKINRRRVQAFGIDAMIGWWRRIDVAGLLFPSALLFWTEGYAGWGGVALGSKVAVVD